MLIIHAAAHAWGTMTTRCGLFLLRHFGDPALGREQQTGDGRRVLPCRGGANLAEYESVIPKTLAEELPEIDPHPKLAWVRAKARLVEPSPLGKRQSRDAKDDIYLAGALAASAQFIVTYDKDLLDLEKPFGIEVIRPPEFLRRLEA